MNRYDSFGYGQPKVGRRRRTRPLKARARKRRRVAKGRRG